MTGDGRQRTDKNFEFRNSNFESLTLCAMPYALCGEQSKPQRTLSHKWIVLLLLADSGLGRRAVIVSRKNQSVIGQR